MKDLTKVQKDFMLDAGGKKNYEGGKRYFVLHGGKNPRRQYGKLKTCPVCGEKYFLTNYQIKRGKNFYMKGPGCCYRCNRRHGNNRRGFLQLWTGYKTKTKPGYIMVYMPDHPFCNTQGHISEHRLVMEKHLGRYLKKKERIHHINDIKDDNRIENLLLFENNNEHQKFHRLLRKVEKTIFQIINQGWIGASLPSSPA